MHAGVGVASPVVLEDLDSMCKLQIMINVKNSIRDACTSQPGEIVFNTMRYRSSETVQRSGYYQSSVSYIKVEIMFKQRK